MTTDQILLAVGVWLWLCAAAWCGFTVGTRHRRRQRQAWDARRRHPTFDEHVADVHRIVDDIPPEDRPDWPGGR